MRSSRQNRQPALQMGGARSPGARVLPQRDYPAHSRRVPRGAQRPPARAARAVLARGLQRPGDDELLQRFQLAVWPNGAGPWREQRLHGVRGLGAGQLGDRLQDTCGPCREPRRSHRRRPPRVDAQADFWCIGPPRLVESQRGHRVGRSLSRMKLDPHAIRAVVEGEHGDPFAVLGPHRVQTPDGSAVAVRAILPGRPPSASCPPTRHRPRWSGCTSWVISGVTHVPGLNCYRCVRTVPTPNSRLQRTRAAAFLRWRGVRSWRRCSRR